MATLEKHGLDFASLDETFFLNARIIPAKANRYFAIGRLADNTVVVVFAYLWTEGLSVITMRRAKCQGKEAGRMIRKKSKFEPGRGYTKKDWDEADIPALADEQLKQAKPFAEVFPEMAAKMEKNLGGRPPLEKPKKAINIRLDQDVIEKFRRTGPGWQSRINEALKAAKVG